MILNGYPYSQKKNQCDSLGYRPWGQESAVSGSRHQEDRLGEEMPLISILQRSYIISWKSQVHMEVWKLEPPAIRRRPDISQSLESMVNPSIPCCVGSTWFNQHCTMRISHGPDCFLRVQSHFVLLQSRSSCFTSSFMSKIIFVCWSRRCHSFVLSSPLSGWTWLGQVLPIFDRTILISISGETVCEVPVWLHLPPPWCRALWCLLLLVWWYPSLAVGPPFMIQGLRKSKILRHWVILKLAVVSKLAHPLQPRECRLQALSHKSIQCKHDPITSVGWSKRD